MKIQDFSGRVSNLDPQDLPPGAAQSQVNVSTNVPGRLLPRLGIAPLEFSNAAAADAGARTLSAYLYQTPGAEIVVYHLSNGKIKQGRI